MLWRAHAKRFLFHLHQASYIDSVTFMKALRLLNSSGVLGKTPVVDSCVEKVKIGNAILYRADCF